MYIYIYIYICIKPNVNSHNLISIFMATFKYQFIHLIYLYFYIS